VRPLSHEKEDWHGELEQRLECLSGPSLLERALTHSSYANENRGARLRSNERLEF
jgi:ribonuclease-3